MATTPNTLTSSEYWISPDALTIELNALDNPQYLQVSLLAGTVITAFRQGVIDYDASLNYRKWNLQAYNNFFDRTDRAYVYAQLDKNGNNALIIYSYDVLELIETITEDSGETRDVYNVFLATISPSINSNGESVFRTWEKELDTGGLSTDKVSSEWKGFFEKRTDSKGNSYLYTEFNLVSRLGFTAYGSSGFEVPSIFDGIPWDNTTIWKNPETGLIEVIGGTGGGSDFDATAMWSALLAATSEQINKSHLTDALSGYALQTSLDEVSTKLNDFLEGSDTDTIINKWKELEVFLSGMAEADNLAEILSNKADTTELAKYVTLDTEQSINGQKTFIKTIYQGPSLANRRAISFVDTSNNAIFADINGRTIFRGNLLSFQLVNGTDIAKINNNGLFVDNVIESSNSVKSLDLYINGVRVYKENGVLFIDGDLAVTGGITAYAQGSRTPSTILDGLIIDETTLSKEGGKLSVIGGVGGASNWDELEGKPSWIGDTKPSYDWSEINNKPTTIKGFGIIDGITSAKLTGSGNAITDVSISGHELTLIKNSTFSISGHTHTFTSLTNKPTTLSGYGITDAVTLDTKQFITGEKIFSNTIYQGSSIDVRRAVSFVDNSWNCILSDTKGATILRGSIIRFQQVNGADIATIQDNNFYIKNFEVWHKGNDSSLFVSLRGVLNLSDIDNFVNRSSGTYQVSGTGSSGLLTVFKNVGGSTSALELFTWYDWSRAKIRMTIDSNRYSSWKDLAFLDSNVASATKLQTARYIFGQSFNGEQDVNGTVKCSSVMSTNIRIECDNNGVLGSRTSEINNYNSHLYLQHNSSTNLYCCTGGGNVGIGTTSPTRKLDVNGDIIASSWIRTRGQAGWYSETYDGGWYMIDYTYVRSYSGKKVYSGGGYLAPYGGGMWISMATRSNIIDGDQNQSTNGAHALYRVKTNGGHAVVFGGLDNNVGFYGFYKSRIDSNENGTDWSTTWDATNGTITHRGNFLATGGITCYASDQRAKTVIEQIKLSLKQIANAPTIRFKWNDWKIKDDGKTHIGGIAQYMQKLLPETVLEADDMLNMDYATTGYIFAVQTAKHLVKTDTEVERLKKRVKKLEKQLKQLGYEEVNIMDD